MNYLQHHYDQFCQLILATSKLDTGEEAEAEGSMLGLMGDSDKYRKNTIEACSNLRKGL